MCVSVYLNSDVSIGVQKICLVTISISKYIYRYKKVKFSRYRPGVAQRVGRGIALLFHDRGTRRG